MVGLCERTVDIPLKVGGPACNHHRLDSESDALGICNHQDALQHEEESEEPQVPSMPVLGADYETEMEQKLAIVMGDGKTGVSPASVQHYSHMWPTRAMSSFSACSRSVRHSVTGSLPRPASARYRNNADHTAGCDVGLVGTASGDNACLCQRRSASLLYDERSQLFSRLATVPESPRPHRPPANSVRPPLVPISSADAVKFVTKPPPVPAALPIASTNLTSLRAHSLSQPSIAPGLAVSSLSCSDLHQRYHSYYVASASGCRRSMELKAIGSGCVPALVQPVPSADGVIMSLRSDTGCSNATSEPIHAPDVELRSQSIRRKRSRFRRSLSSETASGGSERRQQSRDERQQQQQQSSNWCNSLDRRRRASSVCRGRLTEESSTSDNSHNSGGRTAAWLWRSHSYHNVQTASTTSCAPPTSSSVHYATSGDHLSARASSSSTLSVSSVPGPVCGRDTAVLRRSCLRCSTRSFIHTSCSSDNVDNCSNSSKMMPPVSASSYSTSVLPTSSSPRSLSAASGAGDHVNGSWRRRGSIRRSVRALSGSWRTLLRQVGGMSQRNSTASKPASIPTAPIPADPASVSSLSSPLPQARRVAPPSIPMEGGNSGCRLSGGSFSSGYSGSHESSTGVTATGAVLAEGEAGARRFDGAGVSRYTPLSSNHYYPASTPHHHHHHHHNHSHHLSQQQQQQQQSAISYNCAYASLHNQTLPAASGCAMSGPAPVGSSAPISGCSGREFVPHFHNHLYPPHPHPSSLAEDQGIDVQSPGRDSPSSSGDTSCASGGCRHSSSSLDSGRASYDTARPPGVAYGSSTVITNAPGPHTRYACHSLYDTAPSVCCGPLRHHQSPRHSDSLTSSDDVISQLDVAQMLADGLPDEEVLNAWLTDIHFEEYYRLFVNSGYDLPTISRMTPEDLTAIGVTRPADRRRLTAEIARLRIADRIPDFLPDSLEQWLQLLQLPEYGPQLRSQGYNSVHEVTAVTWEDLEEIGISRLGHQKKITLAIKRAKDILTGRRVPSIYQHQYTTQEIVIGASSESTPASDSSYPPPPATGTTQFRTFQQRHPPPGDHQQPSTNCTCPPQLQPCPPLSCTATGAHCSCPQKFQHDRLHAPACLSPPPPPAPQTHAQYAQQQSLVFTEWSRPPQPTVSPVGDVTGLGGTDLSLPHPLPVSGIGSPRLPGSSTIVATATVTHKPRPVAMITASTRQDFPADPTPHLLKPSAHFPPPPPPLRVGTDSSGSDMDDGEAASPALTRHKMAALGDVSKNNHSQCQSNGDASSESDSWFPFANENAGTIRQKQQQQQPSSQLAAPSCPAGQPQTSTSSTQQTENKGDVLGDIDTMLAGLTDELDAMLQMDHETVVKAE